jgi:hypothetical protein
MLIAREVCYSPDHICCYAVLQVSEVLLPLCGAPSIKSVLTEHKAAGVLGKAVYALVRPLADLQQLAADEGAAGAGPAPSAGRGLKRLASEGQVLAGLLLQLVTVLMDPDISMNPWADRCVCLLQGSILHAVLTQMWFLYGQAAQ